MTPTYLIFLLEAACGSPHHLHAGDAGAACKAAGGAEKDFEHMCFICFITPFVCAPRGSAAMPQSPLAPTMTLQQSWTRKSIIDASFHRRFRACSCVGLAVAATCCLMPLILGMGIGLGLRAAPSGSTV